MRRDQGSPAARHRNYSTRRLGTCRQNAGVVGSAENDADATLLAQRQEGIERLLFEERVAAGEQEEIEIALFGKCLAHLPFIHTGTDRLDDPLFAQLDHGVIATSHQLRNPLVGGGLGTMREDIDVMSEQHIDPVDTEAFERGVHRAHHAVIGIVIDLLPARRVEELADARALSGGRP